MSLTGLREMVVVARGNVGGERVAAGEGVILSLNNSKSKTSFYLELYSLIRNFAD